MSSCRFAAPPCVVLAILIAGSVAPTPVAAASLPANVQARARVLKAAEQRLLMEELDARLERYRARTRRRRGEPAAGARPRRPPDTAEPGDDQGLASGPRPLAHQGTTSAYPNVAVNNRATDMTPSSGQSEVTIAATGSHVVAAFNDGEGFSTGTSIQGFAYSSDGGLTWTDGGIPSAANVGIWAGDPSLAVNEKTGEFYLAGLCQPSSGTNGIGVVKGAFNGTSFFWGTPEVAISGPTSSVVYDKEWVAADSSSGNVYLVYTRFAVASGVVTTDRIDFQRKVGASPFQAPQTLSSDEDAARVQGARVAVGPNGTLWAAWSAVGTIDADSMRVRRSTTFGANWDAQSTAVAYFANFGSGAPGFNRGEGLALPSLAVDRTSGPHRGRAYLAWNESINFYDDPLGQAGTVAEGEPNDAPGTANPFAMGQTLTGAISSGGDNDYWSFSGSEGQTIICQLHATAPLDATFRLFCGDGTSRLAFSRSGSGGDAVLVFTLPSTGTYDLRATSGSGTGAYTIATGLDGLITGRARDHRDVFVCSSDDGATWSTPSRVNDDPAHFDNWLPEITVADVGRPYVVWFDWRDAPASTCGAVSNIYGARSDDGGATWSSLGPLTDAPSAWTSVSTNIIPNQGDYIALYGTPGALYPAWGDGRNGDPDVYSTTIPLIVTTVDGAPEPPMPVLAIRAVRPNPADREMWVSFSLAGPEPAWLELLDIAGRRVSERTVAWGSSQTIDLAAAGSLPSGVYLLRLSQAGHSVVRRVSVVR